ncbi:hypothetical protein AVEN_267630-1 [Araneus ventricosus]|uniref:Uncharacterized protein n=1 Tax=Araneus ventricosus TaxID=182803 RepID=A0A4Y2PK60_ARAVE|nr:hypothetical protein AVEN_267630-1 [Araneus ventricosus]
MVKRLAKRISKSSNTFENKSKNVTEKVECNLKNSTVEMENESENLTENVESHFENPTEKVESHFENPTEKMEGHFENPTEKMEGHFENPTEKMEGHFENPTAKVQSNLENSTRKVKCKTENKRRKYGDNYIDTSTECEDNSIAKFTKYPRIGEMYEDFKKCEAQLKDCINTNQTLMTVNMLKNLFMKFYQKYFKLLWDQRQVITDEVVMREINEKINILNRITPDIRNNAFLDVLLVYVSQDLKMKTAEIYSELYVEDTSENLNRFLETCMEKTIQEMNKLKEKECEDLMGELTDDDEYKSDGYTSDKSL